MQRSSKSGSKAAKARGKKSTTAPIDPDARTSILEALQLLLRHYDGAGHLMRDDFNRALRVGGNVPGGVRLWIDDKEADPGWYASHIRLAARRVPDGQWSFEFEPSSSRLTNLPELRTCSVSARDVAALITAKSAVSRDSHAKRGRKPYEWELYRAKFYLMLYDDDVPAHGDINVQRYADRLMTWGRNNLGEEETPEQAQMRKNVAEWKPLWERLKGFNK